MGASMIRDVLTAAVIRDGKVPSDWEQSFIVCLYKGNGDALERGNYRGLKLTEQVMKILERIVDGLIRQLVSINDSQFGLVPGIYRCNLCCQAAAREVSSCQQETVHGFRRPGEGVCHTGVGSNSIFCNGCKHWVQRNAVGSSA